MVFYPENGDRATRLQQLIDSMANMQTDIKNDAKEMDEKSKAIRPRVKELLNQKGIKDIDELIQNSTAKMTPEERKKVEALIAAAKKTKSGVGYVYFVSSVLIAPEGTVLTYKAVMGLARFIIRIGTLMGVANIFRVAEGGAAATAAIAEATEELANAATEAEAAVKEAAVAGEAGMEVSEAATLLSRAGSVARILGGAGLVLAIVCGIVEAIEGAKQKEGLVDAIHHAQPARLSIAYYKKEASNIQQQLLLFSAYVNAAVGEHKNPEKAATLSDLIISNLTEENAGIDWYELEETLEAQDMQSGSYYGKANLDKDIVVQRAMHS